MTNEKKIKAMADKKVWAVIGATPNPNKVSNKIYHTFKNYGFRAYAVNPNYETMDDGSKIYNRVEDIPEIPDVIDYVVPPNVTMDSLKQLDPGIYPNIWLQPGTYNQEIIEFAENKGFTVVHEGACIMAYLIEKHD
ncbi:MAG TPA: CoA-binding protein [Anaerovoracaceae bacterium]|nr:CoA-binding protein [Anaerovoracaceae bacterium]